MNEANRSSLVSDYTWTSAAAYVSDFPSMTSSPVKPNVDHPWQPEHVSKISPWANVKSTSANGFVPVGAPLEYESLHFEVSDRIAALSKKQDGWKGPDSLSALPLASEYANHFLRKLAKDGIDRQPTVGLDYEGTFSFAWSDGNLSIDLTVYNDGTYSYFATNGERSATADDALLSERISPQLLDLLR